MSHDHDDHDFTPHPRGESRLWLGLIGLGFAWMTLFGLTWWLAGQF